MFRLTSKVLILLECYQIVCGGNIIKNKQNSCICILYKILLPSVRDVLSEQTAPFRAITPSHAHRPNAKVIAQSGPKPSRCQKIVTHYSSITQTSTGWQKKAITIVLLRTATQFRPFRPGCSENTALVAL